MRYWSELDRSCPICSKSATRQCSHCTSSSGVTYFFGGPTFCGSVNDMLCELTKHCVSPTRRLHRHSDVIAGQGSALPTQLRQVMPGTLRRRSLFFGFHFANSTEPSSSLTTFTFKKIQITTLRIGNFGAKLILVRVIFCPCLGNAIHVKIFFIFCNVVQPPVCSTLVHRWTPCAVHRRVYWSKTLTSGSNHRIPQHAVR